MMQKLLIILLLPLYLLTTVRTVVPFIGYAMNYHYIAEQLCENRDKPELHCNGKCHVAKEVQAQSDKEKQEGTKERTQSVDWSCLLLTTQDEPLLPSREISYSAIEFPPIFSPATSPFHPPRI
jgi:hypothetical protein